MFSLLYVHFFTQYFSLQLTLFVFTPAFFSLSGPAEFTPVFHFYYCLNYLHRSLPYTTVFEDASYDYTVDQLLDHMQWRHVFAQLHTTFVAVK